MALDEQLLENLFQLAILFDNLPIIDQINSRESII